ncbi:MAG: hypothetical protein PHS88_02025 [Candidatus Omnitrophica bacterium]|nr:hypothetical protein [Candidatus Omnitrophota bacterium]
MSWFDANPRKTIAIFLVLIVFGAFSLMELILRMTIRFEPSYYVGFENRKNCTMTYPYGTIKINSDGYPDQEFPPKKQNHALPMSVILSAMALVAAMVSEYPIASEGNSLSMNI